MRAPLPLPLRVFVKGASTVGWVAPMGGPRTDLGFPRVLERELLAAGHPTTIRTRTVGGDATANLVRRWEEDVVGFSPDVVVLMAGHYETIHLLWPNWLERHANSFTWAERGWQRAYRKRVLRPLWRALVKAQGALDARLPVAVRRRRIAHAVADIARTVRHVREVGSPLVIVMQTPVPSAVGARLFPGMPDRVRLLNEQLAAAVAALASDEVRLFPTEEVVAEYTEAETGGDRVASMPDGFHFSPALHEVVGRRLAAEVLPWAERQPHLR